MADGHREIRVKWIAIAGRDGNPQRMTRPQIDMTSATDQTTLTPLRPSNKCSASLRGKRMHGANFGIFVGFLLLYGAVPGIRLR